MNALSILENVRIVPSVVESFLLKSLSDFDDMRERNVKEQPSHITVSEGL